MGNMNKLRRRHTNALQSSVNQDIVRFHVGDEEEKFYVHKELLNAHGVDWAKIRYRESAHEDEFGPYIRYPQFAPCVFRGFMG